MTIIQEMWHFAVNQGKQFMDCLILSNRGTPLFTNICFLQLQKGFLNMNLDEKENFITVIMNDYSEVDIKDLFNGFVVTEHQLSLNEEFIESGTIEEFKETISQTTEIEPGPVELKEITRETVQVKRGVKKSFLCHFCGKEFLNSIKLKVHKYQVHSNNEEAFKCSICYKVMKTKSILYKHMFIHSEPRFSCIHCSRVWIIKSHI